MITKEQVSEIVKQKIQGTGIFIVEILIRPGNNIIVQIDTDKGITLDECADLNRFINERLDREDEDYELEVTSPGLSSPFKVREQYLKNIGKKVEVILKDGKKYQGILSKYTEDQIELEILIRDKKDSRNRNPEMGVVQLDQNIIKSTKEVISFK